MGEITAGQDAKDNWKGQLDGGVDKWKEEPSREKSLNNWESCSVWSGSGEGLFLGLQTAASSHGTEEETSSLVSFLIRALIAS